MPPSSPWSYAIVRVAATDAWIPVNDARTIAEFGEDLACEVHLVSSPAALIALLEHPHDGAVRATRELLGMLPLAHFRTLVAELTGNPVPQTSSGKPRPGRG